MPKEMLPYLLTMVLLMIGVYGIIVKRNIIKIIVGVIITEYAVNCFLILQGYKDGGIAPIRTADMKAATFVNKAVDPVPQALVLTSIVIGLGLVALMVALAVRLYEKYGTFDISEIRRLRG